MIKDRFSLKYDDNVPKDYNISELQFTFDFIYLVFERDASISGAIGGVSNKYGLSQDYLMNYLVENKYILNKMNKNEFKRQIKNYNTKSLKKILKKNGLKTSGKRERIEERIFQHKLFANNYYLSSKSKIFYKNKKRRMRIFSEYLIGHYYFNEFNDFYMKNYRKKEAKIPIEFIKLHIEKAIEDKSDLLLKNVSKISVDGVKEKLSITIGISFYPEYKDYRSLFAQADKNLYKGKYTGKNKFVF